MSTLHWNMEKLHSIVSWYGMVSFDLWAPARADTVQKIDPSSAQGQILVAFQDLFDLEFEPRGVAKRLRDLVIGSGKNEHTMAAWQSMIGAIARASHCFEHDTLDRLVETVLELSKYPDSLPYHPIFGEHASNVEPGDLAFSQLPGLGLLLFENLQGPRQYICNMQDVTFQARLAAQNRFKNVNTFAAMLTRVSILGLSCKAMDFSHVALPTISHALENDIPEGSSQNHSTVQYLRMGDPAILQLPAAIQWINVTGRELFQVASRGDTVVSGSIKTGPLWNPTKGEKLWGGNRWEFWRQRLLYLARRGDLDSAISDAAIKAADNLAVILE